MGLTMRQIKSAIETTLQQAFPGVTVHTTGVQTSFERPSFAVRMDNIGSSDQLYSRTRSMDVEIHYFPSDRYQHTLEILDTHDKLEETFGLNLPVADRVITLDDKTAIVVDGVLHFSFHFSYLEEQKQAAEAPLMGELEYRG